MRSVCGDQRTMSRLMSHSHEPSPPASIESTSFASLSRSSALLSDSASRALTVSAKSCARSIASDVRRASSCTREMSLGPRKCPDSADTIVMAPTARSSIIIGAITYERRPSASSSARFSRSATPAMIISSVISLDCVSLVLSTV
jgi:hypothetical protein